MDLEKTVATATKTGSDLVAIQISQPMAQPAGGPADPLRATVRADTSRFYDRLDVARGVLDLDDVDPFRKCALARAAIRFDPDRHSDPRRYGLAHVIADA